MLSCDAIVATAFGTSDLPVFQNSFQQLFEEIRKISSLPVYVGITGTVVRRKLAEQGVILNSVEEALAQAEADGCRRVHIETVLLADGKDYQKILELAEGWRSRFEELEISAPLLEVYHEEMVSYLNRLCCMEENTRYVLFGHGAKNSPNTAYLKLMEELNREDIDLRLIVEEEPTYGSENLIGVPLMLCAGHHIQEMCESYAAFGDRFVLRQGGLLEDEAFRSLLLEKYR